MAAKTIEFYEQRVEQLFKRKYKHEYLDQSRATRKLLEEVGELLEAIGSGSPQDIEFEAADVFFRLCHLVKCANPKVSLEDGFQKKIKIIRDRINQMR